MLPVAYTNTLFGQRFLDYLGPTCFNFTDKEFKKKKTICVSPKYAKQIVIDWLYRNKE